MNLDVEILTAMRGAGAEGVSGVDLSQRLGVSRAAIWARIEDLRTHGYEIEASPHQGYRLLGSPDALHPDDLLSRLGCTKAVGRDIRVFHETTSTNDIVEKLAHDNVKEGAVVFAESQTRGRGRLGRKWVSPAGKGLWFSVLLRPKLAAQQATQLTVASATALRRAIVSQTGLSPEIKWPNDLLVRGLKIAGILTELSAELDQIKYVILGIGVNVNQGQNEIPAEIRPTATSLRVQAGYPINRAELAVSILRELDADYQRLAKGQFPAVAEEWEEHCTTLGQRVSIRVGERQVRGRAESLGEDGALLVRTEHGRLEAIIGGDVVLEKGSHG